ncbi:MAG: alpha/beta hydrolase [Hyphomonas sp.]
MKWFLLFLGLVGLFFGGTYWWAGKDEKPLTREAQAGAPGGFIDTRAGRLHYRVQGPEDGPVVVMVHGYSTPNFIFEQNAAALEAAGFRVVRFDHFGRGWSDRPKGPYTADFYDNELLDLLDGLSLTQPVSLVGLSMGGPIVSEFAVRHPERVSRVALLVPAGLDIGAKGGASAALVRMPVIGDWMWRVSAKKILLSDPQYDESALAPENRLQGDVLEQLKYKGYFPALLSTYRRFHMTGRDDTFRSLAATGLPVMAVYGTDDPTVLISSADKLAALMPEARIVRIAGGTHGLNYQRHEDVNPLLLDFLSEGQGTP